MFSKALVNNLIQFIIHQEQLAPFVEDHIGKIINFTVTEPVQYTAYILFTESGIKITELDSDLTEDAIISGPLSAWVEFLLLNKSPNLNIKGSSDLLQVVEKISHNYDITQNNCWQKLFGSTIGMPLDDMENSIKTKIKTTSSNIIEDIICVH